MKDPKNKLPVFKMSVQVPLEINSPESSSQEDHQRNPPSQSLNFATPSPTPDTTAKEGEIKDAEEKSREPGTMSVTSFRNTPVRRCKSLESIQLSSLPLLTIRRAYSVRDPPNCSGTDSTRISRKEVKLTSI